MPAAAPLALWAAEAAGNVEIFAHQTPSGGMLSNDSDRIRIALTFARERLAEPLPIERLAEAANLSVRQFGRAFRRETGEKPAKAVERLRVEAARENALA